MLLGDRQDHSKYPMNVSHFDVLATYYVAIWLNLAILLDELAEVKEHNFLN
jgi:hypothetical protein